MGGCALESGNPEVGPHPEPEPLPRRFTSEHHGSTSHRNFLTPFWFWFCRLLSVSSRARALIKAAGTPPKGGGQPLDGSSLSANPGTPRPPFDEGILQGVDGGVASQQFFCWTHPHGGR